ncbi:MAG TPA: anti-sigma factor antagonist [Gemmatimonadales bacterium]|nr:anti-sigma factor antagonist [Gemmatimonadales bacterium]
MTLVRVVHTTARLDALEGLLELASRAAREAGADTDGEHDVRLAAEEVLINVMHHAYPAGNPGPLTVRARVEAGALSLTVLDDGTAFSPDMAPAPDLATEWAERRVGGLGWHLVGKLMDEVRHRSPSGRGNELTMIKRFRQPASLSSSAQGMGTMQIEVERRGTVTVAAVQGNVDGLTSAELSRVLGGEVAADGHRLVVSLAGVDYTSSAGLRVLLSVVKEARTLGGDVRLAAVRDNVRKVLELSGFTSILKLFPDVDAAVASFGA